MDDLMNGNIKKQMLGYKFLFRWAKENLEEKKYKKLIRSYISGILTTIIYGIIIIVGYLLLIYSQLDNIKKFIPINVIGGYLHEQTVSYVINDEERYVNLKEFNLEKEKYKENDKFAVFLDEKEKVVNLVLEKEVTREKNKPYILLILVMIGIIINTSIIFVPLKEYVFAKTWYKYMKWFSKANLSSDKFNI